jgi:hypothetical protein
MVFKRNYRKEYTNYQGKPEQIKRRSARNSARAMMKKRGVNLAGKDVTHRNGNPLDNSWSNLGVSRMGRNRSFARNRNAGKVNRNA